MNKTEHLLVCLGEEFTEVAHRCSKALRFGAGDIQPGQDLTNAERIVQEFNEALAVIELLQENGVLPSWHILDRDAIGAKKIKIAKFMSYAETRGALQTEQDMADILITVARVASGEHQVADDDVGGMAWIYKYVTDALAKLGKNP